MQEKKSLKIKGIVYKSCVISAMIYGSVTWSLGQNEIDFFAKNSHGENMCGVKLMDKKSTKDQMQILDLNETI